MTTTGSISPLRTAQAQDLRALALASVIALFGVELANGYKFGLVFIAGLSLAGAYAILGRRGEPFFPRKGA